MGKLSDTGQVLGLVSRRDSTCGKITQELVTDHFSSIAFGDLLTNGNRQSLIKGLFFTIQSNDFFWFLRPKFPLIPYKLLYCTRH